MFVLTRIFCRNRKTRLCHIKYINYEGRQKTLKAEGLLSTCIQHEIDHLDGILFIDYLSKIKKDMILKKLTKQEKKR